MAKAKSSISLSNVVGRMVSLNGNHQEDKKHIQFLIQRYCKIIKSRLITTTPREFYEEPITELEMTIESLSDDDTITQEELFTKVTRHLCMDGNGGKNQVWLRCSDANAYSKDGRYRGAHEMGTTKLFNFALGSFLNEGTFFESYNYNENENIEQEVSFEHDRNVLSIYFVSDLYKVFKLEVIYRDIECILVDNGTKTTKLYMVLKGPPKLYLSSDLSHQISGINQDTTTWNREIKTEHCPKETLGSVSTLLLELQPSSKDPLEIVSRFNSLKKSLHFATIVSVFTTNIQLANVLQEAFDDDFNVSWAMGVLQSRGLRATVQMLTNNAQFQTQIKRMSRNVNNDRLCQILYLLADHIEANIFFNMQYALNKLMSGDRDIGQDELHGLKNCRLVRKMVLTPTRMILVAPQISFDNRILRKYGSEFCLRVSLRDDDFNKLTNLVSKDDSVLEATIREPLESGIDICGRKYEFLACSNSQLRDHGIWMYAQDDKLNTARHIRHWMGDFSSIKCVATYMARMGQCFSQSEEGVSVTLDENTSVSRYAPDIEGGADPNGKPYCFSDGIGRISRELAKKVCRKTGRTKIPSGYQIRFGGCKGMLAIDPTMQGQCMEIRRSMEKFECRHQQLEIMKTTQPVQLFLNRPIITLLEQLGIPAKSFIEMQEKMLYDFADMRLYEDQAAKVLKKRTHTKLRYNTLKTSGISLTTEPFFRSLLHAVSKNCIGQLKRRARIEVPAKYGRNMLGVLDETGTLEYEQVFIQYSKDLDNAGENIKILEGEVIVSKMPCFHPGDVKKLNAVDVPCLRHMVDCVVFPKKGKRPHPNEISGSDLDGDEYFVTWDPKLIFCEETREPMDFPSAEKVTVDGEITLNHMAKFIMDYVKNDKVGVIANTHLAQADNEKKGIFSEKCLKLAEIHSYAIDFAKTGYTPNLTPEQRANVYPDFMGKLDHKATYRSKRVLGRLYRNCREIETIIDQDINGSEVKPDPELTYPGFEKYTKVARSEMERYRSQLFSLMKHYGIKTEAEIISGCIGDFHQRLRERQDRFESEAIIRLRIKALHQEIRENFFEDLGDYLQDTNANVPNPTEEMLAKASAYYRITYSQPQSGMQMLSFPWVVGDILANLKLKSMRGHISNPSPVIDDITNGIYDNLDKTKAGKLIEALRTRSQEATYILRLIYYSGDQRTSILAVMEILLAWATFNGIVVDSRQDENTFYSTEFLMVLVFVVREKLDFFTNNTSPVDHGYFLHSVKDMLNNQHLRMVTTTFASDLCIHFLKYCSSSDFSGCSFDSPCGQYEIFPEQARNLQRQAHHAFHAIAHSGSIQPLTEGIMKNLYTELSILVPTPVWIGLKNIRCSKTEWDRRFQMEFPIALQQRYPGLTSATLRRSQGKSPRGILQVFGPHDAVMAAERYIFELTQEHPYQQRVPNIRWR